MASKTNKTRSGIEEDYGELEALLDEIIQQQDQHNEAKLKQKNYRTNADRRVQEAGALIRAAAVSCVRFNQTSAAALTVNFPGHHK